MTVLSQQASDILNRLRDHAESEVAKGWFTVYLDNVRPDSITGHQFAGYLSALQQAGLYRPVSSDWGQVKV